MQKVIHHLPDPFQALILELEEKPMSKQEIELFLINLNKENLTEGIKRKSHIEKMTWPARGICNCL